MHLFDEALALQPSPTLGNHSGHTHPAWQNMVGPYGGITAAVMLKAVMLHPDRLGEPVALTVNFCTAVAQGAFEVQAKPLRTNRSTQHWFISLHQAGECVISATAVTAKRRDSFSSQELAMPKVAAAHDVAPFPDSKFRPEWTRRYDMRGITGGIPTVMDGSHSASLSQLWVRDEPPRALDHLALASLADCFFPRVWLRRKTLVPIGTVSISTYFHCSQAELAAMNAACHLLGQAQGQQFKNGFFDQTAALWAADGQLLVTTQQVVYFKE
jgi:Thioesterase-like superfamily